MLNILHPKYRCYMLGKVNLSFKTFLRRFVVWKVYLTGNWPPKLHQPVSFAFLSTCISKRSSSDVNKIPSTQTPNPTLQVTEIKTHHHVVLQKTSSECSEALYPPCPCGPSLHQTFLHNHEKLWVQTPVLVLSGSGVPERHFPSVCGCWDKNQRGITIIDIV